MGDGFGVHFNYIAAVFQTSRILTYYQRPVINQNLRNLLISGWFVNQRLLTAQMVDLSPITFHVLRLKKFKYQMEDYND